MINSRLTTNRGLRAAVARNQAEINHLRATMQQRDRDAIRYSRLNDLSRDFSFDPDDEMETVLDMNDEQFARHCENTVTKYSRNATGVERYGRGANGGQQSRRDVAQIERYSREAADVAARKNFEKPGSTSFQTEYEAILKQHGIAV